MKASVEIREAISADLPQLCDLVAKCAEAPAWSVPVWQRVLQSAQGSETSRTALIAVLDGQLAGFAVLHKVADEGELENLCVAPRFRRMGLGREISEALFSHARTGGITQVHLEVRESNGAALALYGRLGFEVEGKRPHYYTGPLEDALLLVKRL